MTSDPGIASGHPPVSELTYTQASAELDDIVAFFEQRDVDVDQLVARLERATAIVDELDRRLRRTRTQVEELVPRLTRTAAVPDEADEDVGMAPEEDEIMMEGALEERDEGSSESQGLF